MNILKIQKELDYYKKFVPTNFHSEKERFFKALEEGREYNPQFEYKDDMSRDDYVRLKNELEKEVISDPIVNEFKNVFIKVIEVFIAWKDEDYKKITKLSGDLFGQASEINRNRCGEEYEKLARVSQFEEVLDDNAIGNEFRKEFGKQGLEGWNIEYNEANGGNVSIYELDKKVVIRSGIKKSYEGLRATICHEIEGHAFQAFNAMANKRYRNYFTNYVGTEKQYEGWATYTVINNESKIQINLELILYFSLMVATSWALENSFYTTYKKMYELTGDKEFAFYASYKAKRGFKDTSQAGSFQKENSYLLGTLETIKYIEQDNENVKRLEEGCFPFTVMKYLEPIEHEWQSVKQTNQENIRYFKNIMKKVKN